MRTQNFFLVPRSWQDSESKQCLSSRPYYLTKRSRTKAPTLNTYTIPYYGNYLTKSFDEIVWWNCLMKWFDRIIWWNHFIISKCWNTTFIFYITGDQRYDPTAIFHCVTFSEKRISITQRNMSPCTRPLLKRDRGRGRRDTLGHENGKISCFHFSIISVSCWSL